MGVGHSRRVAMLCVVGSIALKEVHLMALVIKGTKQSAEQGSVAVAPG